MSGGRRGGNILARDVVEATSMCGCVRGRRPQVTDMMSYYYHLLKASHLLKARYLQSIFVSICAGYLLLPVIC